MALYCKIKILIILGTRFSAAMLYLSSCPGLQLDVFAIAIPHYFY